MSQTDEEMKDTIAALSEVLVAPNYLLQVHVGRSFFRGSNNTVTEVASRDDPPLLAQRNGRWVDLKPDFESLLGVYEAETRRIMLFDKGIGWLANERDWEPNRLRLIVRLHEWSHTLHHLGAPKQHTAKGMAVPRGFAERNARFRAAPDDLKEQIAQFGTLVALRGQAAGVRHPRARATLEDIERIFFELMDTQSRRYRLPDEVRSMPLDRLKAKLALLLRMADNRLFPELEDIADILR